MSLSAGCHHYKGGICLKCENPTNTCCRCDIKCAKCKNEVCIDCWDDNNGCPSCCNTYVTDKELIDYIVKKNDQKQMLQCLLNILELSEDEIRNHIVQKKVTRLENRANKRLEKIKDHQVSYISLKFSLDDKKITENNIDNFLSILKEKTIIYNYDSHKTNEWRVWCKWCESMHESTIRYTPKSILQWVITFWADPKMNYNSDSFPRDKMRFDGINKQNVQLSSDKIEHLLPFVVKADKLNM